MGDEKERGEWPACSGPGSEGSGAPKGRRLWPPVGGGLCRRVVKKVQKVQRVQRWKVDGDFVPKVLKVPGIDGPWGRGCGIAAFGGDEFYSPRYASAFPPSKSF